ncbi:porin family protein [Lacinutrix undariae]
MKKLLFTAAIAVLGLSNVNAQEVTFGAKAGVNFANLGGDIEDNDMKVGFHVGGVAEIAISEKFSVQPELLFSSQGTKFEESGETLKYNLSYINVPVMAKYYVAEGFSVEAGPQVGFLVDAKAKYDSDSEDIKDAFNSVDFGLNLGAGYKLDNGFNFSARYNLGLANIAKDAGDDFSIQNNVIQLSVGYSFN